MKGQAKLISIFKARPLQRTLIVQLTSCAIVHSSVPHAVYALSKQTKLHPNPADIDSRLPNKMNRAALTLRSTVAASASRRFLSSRALRLQTARSFVTANSFGNSALFSSHIQGHGALQSIVSAPGAKLQVRGFAESATFLDEKEVEERVLAVVKAFEKVDAAKVTPTSHFARDLGLDSLDAVEVVMAFEEEFVIEIPDAEAENILTCEDAIKFIAAHPQAR